MELIIKNNSNVKITICKDEAIISTKVGDDKHSSSIIETCDGIFVKVD